MPLIRYHPKALTAGPWRVHDGKPEYAAGYAALEHAIDAHPDARIDIMSYHRYLQDIRKRVRGRLV